ncbi:linear amide C-N hydrolase [Nodosilinea sp. P-1105]|nr:linear amide C-N hydrolase [Nodosilinea sp. P-1105]
MINSGHRDPVWPLYPGGAASVRRGQTARPPPPGKKSINPVGSVTNGPRFDWHLTNLSHYTCLSNVDQLTNTFGSLKVSQPDFSIATSMA